MTKGILSDALAQHIDNQAPLVAEIELGGEKHMLASTVLSPSDFTAVNARLMKGLSRKDRGDFVPFQNDPTNFDGQITMLIRKARIAEGDKETGYTLGEPAFTIADKPKLNRLGVEVVSRIFTDLFKDQIAVSDEDEDDLIEDAEGN